MNTKIKKGDICVLTYNRNTIFEYDGVNKFGFPLTCRSCTPTASMDPDAVMYEFHVSKSLIMQYRKTENGGWLGYCINIFDYDFYNIYEIISFTPITNLTIIDEDKVLKN